MKEKCWRDVFGGSAPHVLQIFLSKLELFTIGAILTEESEKTVSFLNSIVIFCS